MRGHTDLELEVLGTRNRRVCGTDRARLSQHREDTHELTSLGDAWRSSPQRIVGQERLVMPRGRFRSQRKTRRSRTRYVVKHWADAVGADPVQQALHWNRLGWPTTPQLQRQRAHVDSGPVVARHQIQPFAPQSPSRRAQRPHCATGPRSAPTPVFWSEQLPRCFVTRCHRVAVQRLPPPRVGQRSPTAHIGQGGRHRSQKIM